MAVCRVGIISGGVELLGCPIWRSLDFFSDCFNQSFLCLSQAHTLLGDLEDPQVELHSLRSCLGVCKITHLLHCVPPDVVQPFLPRFDALLHASLDHICRRGLSDSAWCQVTLPFRLAKWFRPTGFSEHYCVSIPSGMCPQWSAVVGNSPHSDKIAPTQAKIATTISYILIQISHCTHLF